ncbi:MAG: tetratricopeptide repeat protein [Thermoanaerobaculia bacterium]|nr:tetratricopeptide repeat protein [Thermoanaerobaculia bacterium]MBP9826557.1 tetratricopeptide repeat protein [Thermoanaerobaculia bacterium]
MPSAAREESQAGLWRIGALVFLVAFAVRGLHLAFFRSASFFPLLVGDARGYEAWARRLAAGDWVGSEVFYQAPLYPYLLGLWYALAGPDLLALRVLQIALGALACALVAVASGRLFGRNAGWAAGLLLAFYAPAIFFDLLVQKAVLDLLLVALLLQLVSLLVERVDRRLAFWAGVVLGLLVLSRENAVVLLPVFLAWIWCRARPRAASVLLCVAGVAAVLAPVAVRNYRIGGELQLTTAQLGPNLYIGNHDGATGSYVPLRPGRGDASFERRDAADLAEAASGRKLTAGEVSRYWRERATGWIRAHPGRWLELLGRKLLLAWNGQEAMDTEDLATHAEVSPPLRWLARLAHFGLLAPLALLGIWWSRERGRELWVLHASIGVYTASLVAFYVVARYRLPLVPMLAPFAGFALVEIPARWRRGPAGERLRAGLILAVAGLMVNLPLLPRLAGASGESLRALTHLNYAQAFEVQGKSEEASAQYRRALELDPANAHAHTNLGVLAAGRGEREAALRHFQAAAASAPGQARNQSNLGVELQVQGRTAEAIASFERAVALEPRDAGFRFQLGAALAAAGRPGSAIAQFEEFLRLEPGDAEGVQAAKAHNNLGILLASTGRAAEAVPHFAAAVRLDPDFRDAALNLARARDLSIAGPAAP